MRIGLSKLRKLVPGYAHALFTLTLDLLWLITLALGPIAIVYGISLIHRPTAWIIGGLLFFIAHRGGIHPMLKFCLKMTSTRNEREE